MKRVYTSLSYAKISRNEFRNLSHIKRRAVLICIRLELRLKKVLDFFGNVFKVQA